MDRQAGAQRPGRERILAQMSVEERELRRRQSADCPPLFRWPAPTMEASAAERLGLSGLSASCGGSGRCGDPARERPL